jgi:hypothetical protein
VARADVPQRPDRLAGTTPPYVGLIFDLGMLECLAQGVVNARLQVWAADLLHEMRANLQEPDHGH